jgi:hypothetical protein
MFIPRNTHKHSVLKLVVCRWCHEHNLKKHMFVVRDGPIDRWFCDTNCAAKWTENRHCIGVAHVLKMSSSIRQQYLKGKTIEEFISNGMKVE